MPTGPSTAAVLSSPASTVPSATTMDAKGWLGSVPRGWKKTRTLSHAGRFSLTAASRSSHADIQVGPRRGSRYVRVARSYRREFVSGSCRSVTSQARVWVSMPGATPGPGRKRSTRRVPSALVVSAHASRTSRCRMRVERSAADPDAGSAGENSTCVSGWILTAAGENALPASPLRRTRLLPPQPMREAGAIARSITARSVPSGADARELVACGRVAMP